MPITEQQILEMAAQRASFSTADIAELYGFNPRSIHSPRYQHLLPGFGLVLSGDKSRFRSWTALELEAWNQIPEERRAKGKSALSDVSKEQLIAEWKQNIAELNENGLVGYHKILEDSKRIDQLEEQLASLQQRLENVFNAFGGVK